MTNKEKKTKKKKNDVLLHKRIKTQTYTELVWKGKN